MVLRALHRKSSDHRPACGMIRAHCSFLYHAVKRLSGVEPDTGSSIGTFSVLAACRSSSFLKILQSRSCCFQCELVDPPNRQRHVVVFLEIRFWLVLVPNIVFVERLNSYVK